MKNDRKRSFQGPFRTVVTAMGTWRPACRHRYVLLRDKELNIRQAVFDTRTSRRNPHACFHPLADATPSKRKLHKLRLRRPEVGLPGAVLVREEPRGGLRALQGMHDVGVGHAMLAHQSVHFIVGHRLASTGSLHGF